MVFIMFFCRIWRSIMDEMYDIILNEGYGMKLKSAARTRTCLVCTTDKGIFDLKKNIYDENIVVFEVEIKSVLNETALTVLFLLKKPLTAIFFMNTTTADILLKHIKILFSLPMTENGII